MTAKGVGLIGIDHAQEDGVAGFDLTGAIGDSDQVRTPKASVVQSSECTVCR